MASSGTGTVPRGYHSGARAGHPLTSKPRQQQGDSAFVQEPFRALPPAPAAHRRHWRRLVSPCGCRWQAAMVWRSSCCRLPLSCPQLPKQPGRSPAAGVQWDEAGVL